MTCTCTDNDGFLWCEFSTTGDIINNTAECAIIIQAFLSQHVLQFNFLETFLVILGDLFIHLTIICNLPQNVENLLSNLV